MTRWTYEDVRPIYRDRDRYRDLVRGIAQETCLRAATAFRGECGRDGQPQEGWCHVCRAKALVAEDEKRWATLGTKQVIVIRKDLKMRRGKEIAQGAHASMAWLGNRLRDYLTPLEGALPTTPNCVPDFNTVERAWLTGKFTKIVCQVGSETELREVYETAERADIEAHLIVDSGATEFGGEPTPTACGIGPADAAAIDAITGTLKLY